MNGLKYVYVIIIEAKMFEEFKFNSIFFIFIYN